MHLILFEYIIMRVYSQRRQWLRFCGKIYLECTFLKTVLKNCFINQIVIFNGTYSREQELMFKARILHKCGIHCSYVKTL